MTPYTERVRTHLTPALLRIGMYEESGDPRHIDDAVQALGRALTAAVEERVRCDEQVDREFFQARAG